MCVRLYMLEEQCNTWQGITSVAVYYPLYIFQSTNADRLREAITTVENFHEQIDRSHGERIFLKALPNVPEEEKGRQQY